MPAPPSTYNSSMRASARWVACGVSRALCGSGQAPVRVADPNGLPARFDAGSSHRSGAAALVGAVAGEAHDREGQRHVEQGAAARQPRPSRATGRFGCWSMCPGVALDEMLQSGRDASRRSLMRRPSSNRRSRASRSVANRTSNRVNPAVRDIIAAMRSEGDQAVQRYNERFGRAAPRLVMNEYPGAAALARLAPDAREALELAAARVRTVSRAPARSRLSLR